MEKPSKAKLRELATLLHTGVYPENTPVTRAAGTLRRAAEIFRDMADAQEPEEPKSESLRKASARLWPVKATSVSDHTADLCAIVVRRVRRLAGLVRLHFEGTSSWDDIDRAIQGECAVLDKMIEGSE